MLDPNKTVQVSESPFATAQEAECYKKWMLLVQSVLFKPNENRNSQDSAAIQKFI